MASVRSYMYLKYNVNEHLSNEFLTHKDNSQARIPLPYAWSFFFSTVSTDTATLYSCREEVIFVIFLPCSIWESTVSLHLLGKSGMILSQSFTQLPLARSGQVSKGCTPFSRLTENEETSATQQP